VGGEVQGPQRHEHEFWHFQLLDSVALLAGPRGPSFPLWHDTLKQRRFKERRPESWGGKSTSGPPALQAAQQVDAMRWGKPAGGFGANTASPHTPVVEARASHCAAAPLAGGSRLPPPRPPRCPCYNYRPRGSTRTRWLSL
jgi:hypothetical protein